jgi:DUF4097 and DUF4098 domain-containing protein YvlB
MTTMIIMLLAAGLFAREPQVETFELGMGETFEFSMRNGGNIEIEGWNRPEVQLTYVLRERNSDFFWETTRMDGKLTLIGDEEENHKHGLNMKVKMPYQANLELYTSGGNVGLVNLEGKISGRTMGGNFQFSELYGELEFTTMGGNVSGSKANLVGWVKTMGGNMNFQDVVGLINSETMGGNINLENKDSFDNPEFFDSPLELKTMGGNVNANQAPAGAKISTMGGNINVAEARNFVDADTKGGNITVDYLDGWLKAHTLGGNVTVKMAENLTTGNHDIEISSKGGDIKIFLPSDFNAEFDVEIEMTKDRRREVDIITDFGLQKAIDSKWTMKRGQSSKTLRAKGISGSGDYKVTVRTVDGDVEILKN